MIAELTPVACVATQPFAALGAAITLIFILAVVTNEE